MSDNIIGGEGHQGQPTKGKQCVHCGEPFGFQEFTNYMFRIWSNQIDCIACPKSNYLAGSKNTVLKIILFLIAVLLGIAFFLAVNISYAVATYNEFDGTYRISYLFLAVGGAVGIGLVKYTMAIFRWMTGTLMKKNLDH